MFLFKINNIYQSSLSSEAIISAISEKLKHEPGLFSSFTYQGKMNKDGFNIIVYRKVNLPTRIKAVIEQKDNVTLLRIEYKPAWNPLFGLLPVYLVCILGLFADNFTLNGEQVSYLIQVLSLLGVLFIFTFFVSIITIGSLRKEIQHTEADLKLK